MFALDSQFQWGTPCPEMASRFSIYSAANENGHRPGGDDARVEEEQLRLRQVITERRQEHVLVRARRSTNTLPGHALQISVLTTEL